jgi:hypothetical protein
MPIDSEIEDLWPDLSATAIVTPASILKTQAAALTRKSKGLIEAQVETAASGLNIAHKLVLIVPALDDYRYPLLQIFHAVTPLYPVYVNEGPIEDVGDVHPRQLSDEGSFREWLRETLASNRTKDILESLLAQATA